MKKVKFVPGIKLESDTLYSCDEKTCHIHLADTIVTQGAAGSTPELSPANQQEVHTAFILKNLRNVTFDLGGAKLMFHGRIQPFAIEDCENIQFKNFTIDYDRYFYTEAEILEVENERLRLRIGEEYPFRIENDALVATSETWESDMSLMNSHIIPIDPVEKIPLRTTGFMFYAMGENPFLRSDPPMPFTRCRFRHLKGREVEMLLNVPAGLRPGHILSIAHEDRRKPVFDATRVRDLRVENVRILHTGSLGLIAYECHDIYVRRLQMFLDHESRGLIAANADAVHSFHCDGKISLEDCRIENIFDDTVNVHGNYAVLKNVTGKTSFAATMPGASLSSRIPLYRRGDVLRAFRGATQEVLGEFTIDDVIDSDIRHLEFATREAVDNLSGAVLFENLRMPELHIQRLITGNKYRAILPSTGAKIVIEDSTFFRCPVAISLTGDSSYWYESGPVRDMTVRNCRFTDPGCDAFAIQSNPIFEPTAREPYYHRNVKILDNRFELPTGHVLQAKYTDEIVLSGNTSTSPVVCELEKCGKCSGISSPNVDSL
jgi:hypothetical protein